MSSPVVEAAQVFLARREDVAVDDIGQVLGDYLIGSDRWWLPSLGVIHTAVEP